MCKPSSVFGSSPQSRKWLQPSKMQSRGRQRGASRDGTTLRRGSGSRDGAALRQEDSEVVWNELSHFRSKCHDLEKQMEILEEERDALQAKYLRNQTTVAELRRCLQHERDDLERKIDAISELEPSVVAAPNNQQQKVTELELALLQKQHQEEELVERLKSSQMECYQLRQEASQIQASFMKLKHQQQLKKLNTLSKATMTDQASSSSSGDSLLLPAYPSSTTVTDSATQVDLEPLGSSPPQARPELRDAQVSPLYPWRSPANFSRQPFGVRQPLAGATSPRHSPTRKMHHRAYSDGEMLLHRRKAKVALSSVRELSRSFHEGSHESSFVHANETSTEPNQTVFSNGKQVKTGKDGETATVAVGISHHQGLKVHVQKCVQASSPQVSRNHPPSEKGGKLKSRKGPGCSTVVGPHKCVWQQQVKTLQLRVKTLSKQVAIMTAAKQALAQSVEDERALGEKARSETKELTQRLQNNKAMMQKLSEAKQQLEVRCSSFERQAGDSGVQRKADAEAKRRLEAEQTALSQKCAKASETVKSLEAQLEKKTSELTRSEERCNRLERDVRQKRQLIEDQREKLKMTKEKSSQAQQKEKKLTADVASLQESLNQSKQKVESFRTQLSRQSSEKLKMMEALGKCRDELAQTLVRLSACQEDNERRKQLVASTKQAHQQKLQQVEKETAKRVTQMESVHKAQEAVVAELQDFVKALAGELEMKQQFSRLQPHGHNPHEHHDPQSPGGVSSRARDIARSALNLSDGELEEFFSDIDSGKGAAAAESGQKSSFVQQVEGLITSKPPFAAGLVKSFLDFLKTE